VSFAAELKEPAFAARELFLASTSRNGTRALAREILMMEPHDYAAAFKGSAIKRAKLWMLKRNACVVLGNVGTDEDLAVLEAMLGHEHEVVRDHAAWATAQLQPNRVPETTLRGDPRRADTHRGGGRRCARRAPRATTRCSATD
jgi:HEAT repeat protein